jgi:hypothetical protein
MAGIANPARSATGGVSECLADGLDASDNSRNRRALQDSAEIDGPRFAHLIERLHGLGPRPTAELLIEIANRTGQSKFIADRLQAYTGLDPEIVRAVGGDGFPPSVWCGVCLNDEAAV